MWWTAVAGQQDIFAGCLKMTVYSHFQRRHEDAPLSHNQKLQFFWRSTSNITYTHNTKHKQSHMLVLLRTKKWNKILRINNDYYISRKEYEQVIPCNCEIEDDNRD